MHSWGNSMSALVHLRAASFGFAALLAIFGTFISTERASAASDIENACTIMQEKTTWRGAAHAASKKWNVPVPAILAVIHQESRFKANAAASNSTAYGFAQVLDGTWNWYRKATEASDAVRTNFADSADFIGWYMAHAKDRMGLPTHDVASHYLVYHEGHVGYRSGRWQTKPALMNVAEKVARIALRYEEQLRSCNIAQTAGQSPNYVVRPKAKPFALENVAAVLPKRKPIGRLIAAASYVTTTKQVQ